MNSINNSPAFKGVRAFEHAVKNPPHKHPTTQEQKDENVFAAGVGLGIDMMAGINNTISSLIVVGGAITGALMPKKIINGVSSLVSGTKNVIDKEIKKIPMATRGKAALIGGALSAGVAAVVGFGLRTVMSLMPSSKVVDSTTFVNNPKD